MVLLILSKTSIGGKINGTVRGLRHGCHPQATRGGHVSEGAGDDEQSMAATPAPALGRDRKEKGRTTGACASDGGNRGGS